MTLQEDTVVETEAGADEAPAVVSEVQILPVRPEVLADMWPAVKPMVSSALAHSGGERSADDILAMVMAEEAVFWVVIKASKLTGCAVANAVQWPRMKVATAIIVAGDGWDEWGADLDRTLTDWARRLGCDVLDGWGREGWPKRLAPLGYRRVYTVVRKEL